jgi:hypothetical protein
MRTANLCDLAWGGYQATGKKLSAVTPHSSVCHDCVTALSFFQEAYFSVRAKAHKTTVRTPIVEQSFRDVFTC